MKILHFIYDHTANPWVGGGGAVRAREIYKRLIQRHDVTIVCGKYPGAEDYREGALSFHFVGTEKDSYILSTFCYAWNAIRFLRKCGHMADIVIEDFAPYNPLLSRFFTRTPLALQLHHREGLNLLKRYAVLGFPFFLAEKVYPGFFENVICVSVASKEKFGIRNAAVIPNGIDETMFKVSEEEGDHISFMGRLHIHNKGLDTLVQAAALSGGKLAIAGRGRDEGKLRKMGMDAGLAGHLELKGFISDEEKAKMISGSKFFVLPSRYEGQGIVVLEAAALGKPVIVSDIPELRYAVEAGFGISFRTGDARDLADKMNILMANEQMRKKMGRRAREYAKDFTWDRIAEEYERCLLSVASFKGRA